MWILWLSMKWIMNQNSASFHEEKKPFKYEYSGYLWEIMNQNSAPFHEENKSLKCECFGYSFSQKES